MAVRKFADPTCYLGSDTDPGTKDSSIDPYPHGEDDDIDTDIDTPLISAPLVSFIPHTELGSISVGPLLASIKTKLARFGRQYLTPSELRILAANSNSPQPTTGGPPSPASPPTTNTTGSINYPPSQSPSPGQSSGDDAQDRRIVHLLAEKETKNVYYQARLLGAVFTPVLRWEPSEGLNVGPNDNNSLRGAGIVYIRLNFQPLDSDIIFKWATVELEFTAYQTSPPSQRPLHPPRIVLFSPIHLKDVPTKRTRTLSRGFQLAAGTESGSSAGVPGLGLVGRGTFNMHTQQETKDVGQRMIQGTLRGAGANRVVWTIGGDKVTGEGVLSVYYLAAVVQLPLDSGPLGTNQVDVGANLKIEAMTNVKRHKVMVNAKDVPIRFRNVVDNDCSRVGTVNVHPQSRGNETAVPAADGVSRDIQEVNVVVDRAGCAQTDKKSGRYSDALLGVLQAETEADAQIRLDALTVPQ